MVSLGSVDKIISKYDVDTRFVKHSSNRRTLLDIVSRRNKKLVIKLAFTDGNLSEIYFINNQFYELADYEFSQLLTDLLDGAYEVRGYCDKKYIVSIHNIGPERTVSDSESDYSLYDELPAPFRSEQ